MRVMILIVLAFLIQLTSSSKFIKFLRRGTINKCDSEGNYVFELLTDEYEGVNSFTLFLKEPSYASAYCSIDEDISDFPFIITCKILGKNYPLKKAKVELPESLSNVDFEYSGWEDVVSPPVLNNAATCITNEFEFSNFYPESKEKVEYTCLSSDRYELKIPGLFRPNKSFKIADYNLIVLMKCDNNMIGCDDTCILSINDKVNITHAKSELKCIFKGIKTVEFFPTISTNIDNEIQAYLHISEKYNLGCNSSSFFYKVNFLLIFLLLILF
jgi:hypothetical protein